MDNYDGNRKNAEAQLLCSADQRDEHTGGGCNDAGFYESLGIRNSAVPDDAVVGLKQQKGNGKNAGGKQHIIHKSREGNILYIKIESKDISNAVSKYRDHYIEAQHDPFRQNTCAEGLI